MRRLAPFVLILAAVAGLANAQSLGEVAARTNKERKGKAGKVYTNDDLQEAHSAAPEQPVATTETAASTPVAPTMDPAQRWRRDARNRREAISKAEANVAAIQARLNALLVDRDPTNVLDPNRLQTLEADRAKASQDLEAAKEALAKARQALEDLEEEARKQGVPPGWLREP
jgi:hypothetical protein